MEVLRRHLSERTEKYHENPLQAVSGHEPSSDHHTETSDKNCIAIVVRQFSGPCEKVQGGPNTTGTFCV